HGAPTLSDADLLAVILGTGLRGKNAIHLAHEILGGPAQNLRNRDLKTLLAAPGLGPAKVARIAAAIELGRRFVNAPPEPQPPLFDTWAFGAELVRTHGRHQQERFGIALLDARHRIRDQREIFIGTMDKTLVSARDVIRLACVENAKGIVLFHNHPSGDPTPSEQDITFTRQLRETIEKVDIDFVDHLIIGIHRFTSMKEMGLL
ncbi:MAG TPA: DNA repair protein RadC, partial [Thermoanaerobaculia bacterium]|nr:DNA repair protein RadC [Thermoanaerobaculia bacterium]